jgi:predicted dienelactone hydrolase
MVAQKPFDSAFGSAPQPVVTFSPVVLPVPGRQVDLQIKVSAPARGSNLPIIPFSHGHGRSNFLSSLHGYGVLLDDAEFGQRGLELWAGVQLGGQSC